MVQRETEVQEDLGWQMKRIRLPGSKAVWISQEQRRASPALWQLGGNVNIVMLARRAFLGEVSGKRKDEESDYLTA